MTNKIKFENFPVSFVQLVNDNELEDDDKKNAPVKESFNVHRHSWPFEKEKCFLLWLLPFKQRHPICRTI